MEEIRFISEFNYLMLIYGVMVLLLYLFFSLKGSIKKQVFYLLMCSLTFLLGAYVVYIIGSRDMNIGVDTPNYHYNFITSENLKLKFEFLFSLLNSFFFSFFSFTHFLVFCAFIYVFASYKSFRMIFPSHFFLVFFFFLVYPYFIQFGINVMRNGMAASIYLLAISYLLLEKRKIYHVLAVLSIGVHSSMLFPFIVVFILSKINLKVNTIIIISFIIGFFGVIGFDFSILKVLLPLKYQSYLSFLHEEESQLMLYFGLPFLYIMYILYVKKYDDEKYNWLLRLYLLLQIPFLLFSEMRYVIRVNYLSGFLIPFIYFYPLYNRYNGILLHKRIHTLLVYLLLLIFLVLKSIKLWSL